MAQRLNERWQGSCELVPAWAGWTHGTKQAVWPPQLRAGASPIPAEPQPARAGLNPATYSLFLIFHLMKREFLPLVDQNRNPSEESFL